MDRESRANADRHENAAIYLIGGGIASLSAAAFLIRDAGLRGGQIHVFEQSGTFGGSLDGMGSPETGYVIRGGRMFEPHFACTYDLFDSIPSRGDSGKSVTQELNEFTQQVVTSSSCRLVSDGKRIEAPEFQLSLRDKWDLTRLAICSEESLGNSTIEEYFTPAFMRTNFWIMWATMFAFQPWHSTAEFRRYMRRFMHLLPGFNRLEGICRTPLNQYDSMIVPLVEWLRACGTQLHLDTQITRIDFGQDERRSQVSGIHTVCDGTVGIIRVEESDSVFITLGSMTEASSFGSMSSSPAASNPNIVGAWSLWKEIAEYSPRFGRPNVFCNSVERTKWESFTVTLQENTFFDFMEEFTGNSHGTGGLVTFRDSNWLMSIVLAHQPHFQNQPDEIRVFWGYGLFPDREGNCVPKKMQDCTGTEILTELFFHLRQELLGKTVIPTANCIPCMMPYITSQFMPRKKGDRPAVVPEGAVNYAFIGQFCELPEDVVFTVEYSVRSAKVAVSRLLGLKKKVNPVYRGYRNPKVLYRAVRALIR